MRVKGLLPAAYSRWQDACGGAPWVVSAVRSRRSTIAVAISLLPTVMMIGPVPDVPMPTARTSLLDRTFSFGPVW